MSSPDLSVVIVHHRGLEHLLECLDGVAAAAKGTRACETILVDNTEGRQPLGEVFRRHPAVRHVLAPGNVGFARGCRLGVEAARAPAIVLVNDDAVLEPDALERLSAALSGAAGDVAAVAGRLTDRTGEKNDFSGGFLTFDGHAFQSDVGKPIAALPEARPGEERLFACGGLMAARRDLFLDSGGFDDDYFAYLEDVDFGWRQWIFGRRVLAEPRAVARHRGGATGEALGIYSRGFLIEKNAFATAFKNFDREHFAALMPAVLGAFVTRLAEMLSKRNPGAAELQRDPYAQAPPGRSIAARLFGVQPEAGRRVTLDDPLTVAQARALLWIHDHHGSLAEKRRAVQGRRQRTDAEIFAKFPLRLVPTYPGDERFDSEFFRELLAGAPPLVRSSLDAILGGRP
jgi:GT2 family glycosyltransferase